MITNANSNRCTFIAALVFASATLLSSGVRAEPTFKLAVHPREVDGTWELVHGEYKRAIALLELGLGRTSRSSVSRGPIVTDLCFAYTKMGDYATATSYCDEAVHSSSSFGVAYNNRGVLRALKGDFEAASADFDIARKRSESADDADFNVRLMPEKVSERPSAVPPDSGTGHEG